MNFTRCRHGYVVSAITAELQTFTTVAAQLQMTRAGGVERDPAHRIATSILKVHVAATAGI